MGVPNPAKEMLVRTYSQCKDGTCPCGLRFNPKEGLVPRGVYGARAEPSDVRLIVVGLNPGRPSNAEMDEYAAAWGSPKRTRPAKLAAATVNWVENQYLDRATKVKRYHSELLGVLERALDVHSGQEVLDRVYFTELVKCSTPRKKGTGRTFSANLFSDDYRAATRKCVKERLIEELRAFPRATVVLAVGWDVHNALCLLTEKKIVRLPHPSRRRLKKSAKSRVVKELESALAVA